MDRYFRPHGWPSGSQVSSDSTRKTYSPEVETMKSAAKPTRAEVVRAIQTLQRFGREGVADPPKVRKS
jgi:hypothetical protein